ncbi:MAG: transposase [Planctomycetales bacterium]
MRRIFDSEGHAQFVTFSCYRRRRLLDDDRCKRIVIGTLGAELAKRSGVCIGFVVMPDHVHALVWFPETHQLSDFMQVWKQRSSVLIHRVLESQLRQYAGSIGRDDPVWQPKYYAFNVWSEDKVHEKLTYMHENPVRAGLVERAADWRWSSARWYDGRCPVGLPIGWVEVSD